jgi:DNA polymerase-1
MVNVAALLAERGARTRMVLNVHDELVFYVPPNELGLVREIQRVMENPSIADDLLVPLVVDVSHSPTSWKDKRSGLPT